MENVTNINNGMTGHDIDLVIPMVFPTDKEWLADFHRFHNLDARQHVRFRSWGTEELLIQCCLKYMPWLHRIYILLARDSQVQPWMHRYPKVEIVMHRDFIPLKYLPCFTSPCIEMFIGRIPGLTEHFIYSNDDVFPLSPMQPTDFFRNGRPCVHITSRQAPRNPNWFEKACLHQQHLVGSRFGKGDTSRMLSSNHSMSPILRSVTHKVWDTLNEDIRRNLCPLRRTEYSYNQYIYLLYQHFADLNTDYSPHEQYLGPGTPTSKLRALILDPNSGTLCLNDNENITDWKHRATIVKTAIAEKLLKE